MYGDTQPRSRFEKDILTVGCITGIVCAPALIVLGLVWQHHLDFIQVRASSVDLPVSLSHAHPDLSPWLSTFARGVILGIETPIEMRADS
jgi:hypothetical protein